MKERTYLIDRLAAPLNRFIQQERSGGIVLGVCVVVAMLLANSPWAHDYFGFFEHKLGFRFDGRPYLEFDLHHWINDGLMAVFFFVVGLELKRELMPGGSLSSPRKALLPIIAAIGGMLVPACIYIMLNADGPGLRGWGIPMATDIAFALGVLYLLGNRVPASLKVFLTALAIVDDLGAVLVIAFFYTSDISLGLLLLGFCFIGLMYAGNHILGIRNLLFYAVLGIAGVWTAFLLSGVHATIAAVLAAFTIPSDVRINGNTLEHAMQPFTAFVVIPVFALANAGVSLAGVSLSTMFSPVTLGVGLGLFAGKLIGVVGSSLLAVSLGLAVFPQGMNLRNLFGLGFLAAIGFTMSIFITSLAFGDSPQGVEAKLGIFTASLSGGLIGYFLLRKRPVK
ncbi:MAG: Na+/H+ antiporter NhaA [Tannerella sp.]|jgi:NhaA family Na+:H+ antiporter|nr:Na+/H+ antiporter NhaA [Tannerella sp.]